MSHVGTHSGGGGYVAFDAQPGDIVIVVVSGRSNTPLLPALKLPNHTWWVGNRAYEWELAGAWSWAQDGGRRDYVHVAHMVIPPGFGISDFNYTYSGGSSFDDDATACVYRGPVEVQAIADASGYSTTPSFPGLDDARGSGDIVRVVMAAGAGLSAALPASHALRLSTSRGVAVGDRVGQTGPVAAASAGSAPNLAWGTFTLFLGGSRVPQPVLVAPSTADGSAPVPISWQPIPGQTARSVRRRVGAGAWQHLTSGGTWSGSVTWLTSSSSTIDLPSMSNGSTYQVQVAARVGVDESDWSSSRTIACRAAPPAPDTITISSTTVRRPQISASGAAGSGNTITGYAISILVGGVVVDSGVAPPGGSWKPAALPDGLVTIEARTMVQGGLTGPPATLAVTISVPPVPAPVVAAVPVTHPASGLPGVRLMITAPGSWGLEVIPEDGDLLVGTMIDATTVDDYDPRPSYRVRIIDEDTDGDLISVMWGTGSSAVSSWRAGAVGAEGSASVSLTGTTAGSLLVGAEPIQASWLAGQVSYGGAVGFNSRSTAAASGQYAAVWLSGTAAGGTATATRSSTYINDLYSWVLVEIPMATPVIGGVVSSATGTVSLTAVPVGGWMLATLIGDGTPPATPSGWTSLATGDSWRIVGKIKAAESSLSVPGADPPEHSAWLTLDTLAGSGEPLTVQQTAQAQWLLDPQRPELALHLLAREDGGETWDMAADRTRYRGAAADAITYRDRVAYLGGTTTVWLQGRADYDGLVALLADQAVLIYRWPPSTDGTPGRVDRMLVTEASVPRFDPGINHDIWPATLSWGPAETHSQMEDDPWL